MKRRTFIFSALAAPFARVATVASPMDRLLAYLARVSRTNYVLSTLKTRPVSTMTFKQAANMTRVK